mmetsp:Transcript_106529/g.308289  ORF Transcript_106529/g.308289 Transcript_106529/m.308289 type:complete len:232 (-) Transcript_106529:8-703(-)
MQLREQRDDPERPGQADQAHDTQHREIGQIPDHATQEVKHQVHRDDPDIHKIPIAPQVKAPVNIEPEQDLHHINHQQHHVRNFDPMRNFCVLIGRSISLQNGDDEIRQQHSAQPCVEFARVQRFRHLFSGMRKPFDVLCMEFFILERAPLLETCNSHSRLRLLEGRRCHRRQLGRHAVRPCDDLLINRRRHLLHIHSGQSGPARNAPTALCSEGFSRTPFQGPRKPAAERV